MFRNRSFRTKLALAIAPPLVVLIALVATVVQPRLNAAADAAHKRDQAVLATANMQLVNELQTERDATIQKIASRPGVALDFEELRGTTNQRRIAFRIALNNFGARDTDERAAIASAEQALSALETLRTQIATGTVGPLQVYEGYETLIALHLGISQAVVRASSDTDLLRQASANLSYVQYKDALARANSYIGLRVESGTLTQTDLLQVSADLAVAGEFRAQFLRSGSDAAVAREQSVSTSAEFKGTIATRDEILLAGSRNRTPAVAPASWWDAAHAQLSAMEAVETQTFGDFAALAQNKETGARQDSTLYLSVLGIGVILAALAAIAFGRSIATRIAKVSSDAHEIASTRLPEVLDALRNPSPEVLAQALPQVVSDSNDEIGSLAESFNTVLRAAVETSIAHAQRRSRTLTNILVNLGRRNQALIDRQLELVDELESTQRDPEVLRGLFQLDHMITSLRRNAENLLVLASDTQARAWSSAVPMIDVVRGAVAEVEDMTRISLELDLTDGSMLTGRYAVDLSHLIAELVDNALSFSPPTTTVHLRSERTSQHYRVWVLDDGLGINDTDLVTANQHVSNPPDVDELSADRIGFQVVGRLALRLGVTVRLQANPGGGLAASVTVPVSLLDAESAFADDGGFSVPPPPAPRAVIAAAPTPAVVTTTSARILPVAPTLEPAPTPTPQAEPVTSPLGVFVPAASVQPPIVPVRAVTLPRRTWLEDSADASVDASSVVANVGATVEDEPAADITTSVAPMMTANGLQRRVPGQAFVGEAKAQQFDSGQFRRLPMPGDRANPLDDSSLAQQRLDAFSRLQSGAGRAREESPSDEL